MCPAENDPLCWVAMNTNEEGAGGGACEDTRILVKEASDPLTSPDRLEVLAKNEVWDVRYKIANNPSTPVHVLASFAKSSDFKHSVAANPSAPSSVLAALAEDASLRPAVAQNPSTPAEVLDFLARDQDSSVRAKVAGNPSCPTSLSKALFARLIHESNESVRRQIANSPSMTPFLLQDLASDRSVLVRREVAKNARTPTPALAKLATEDDRWLREAVAHNPSSSVETLEILASDRFAKVRMAVIDNSSCPEPLRLSTFRGLLSEGDADLIGVMAGEINPVPFYEALKDPLAPVRAIVARYQATPTQLLEILAKDRYQVGACAAALRPLHALIEAHVLSAERLHGDDTPYRSSRCSGYWLTAMRIHFSLRAESAGPFLAGIVFSPESSVARKTAVSVPVRP